MPKLKIVCFFLVVLIGLLFSINVALGDELDDINKQIADLTASLNQSKAATAPLERQLNDIKQRVAFIETDLTRKKAEIDKGYKDLAKQQKILNITIRNFYIKSYYNSPLLVFLSGGDATKITRVLAYQKAAADQDKQIITNIALTINSLEQRKLDLEAEQEKLADTKSKLDKIVTEAKTHQANLSSQIAQLSARQQQILASRLASLNIPLFADVGGGCSSDIGKSPGFSNGFGFFTYGVPNRVGLNQYGAFGRAKAGQNIDTILRAYYNFDAVENRSAQINVEGYGSYSLEDYVKRVYEVPNSWGDQGGMEALKAQAIAVRSYALAYTNNGAGSICTTQQCQVFKPDEKGGNWSAAVDATAGQVMVQGGQVIKAWFSSTHGGYIHTSAEIGWSGTSWTKSGQDTSSSVGNFSDLNNNAYDKDSPWFYCDWGSRSSYNGTAWLQSGEVADIVNVLMLVQLDSGIKEHLYQTDKPNPAGTDTWDAGRVRQELSNRGGSPFSSVSNVSISADFGSGNTTSVTISGDGGTKTFSGSDFKSYFNLRAPANIQIVGPLYNVERI